MNFLYFLAAHRSTVLTVIFEIARYLGEEAVALLIIGYLYIWKDKKMAFEIGFAYFLSGIMANTLKVIFRIPRPWVLDPDFKPLESAVGTATGYSFPSGHSQAAASIYGTLGAASKKKKIRVACIIAFLMVGFSRMYAGVHTPLDVFTGLALGLLSVLIERKLISPLIANEDPALGDCIVLGSMAIMSVAVSAVFTAYGMLDASLAADTYKVAGAAVAFAAAYPLDVKFIHFDNKATPFIKTVRLIVGVGSLLAVKSGLKVLLSPLGNMGHFIRYIIVVAWILIVYPMILMAIKKKKEYNKQVTK